MKAVSFGEILWDLGKSSTLGGAPLNVLGHMRRLGDECVMLSAVGDDKLGDETIKSIKSLCIDVSQIATIEAVETGKAFVTLNKGIPSYAFNSPCAWDAIPVPSPDFFNENYDVFIFGTLSQRSEVTKKTLYTVLQSIKAREVFFDVNLRLNFYSDEIIRTSLAYATILKMNDEELGVVLNATGCKDIKELMASYNLKFVLLTLGKYGSNCFTSDGFIHVDSGDVKVLDTVGAGDSLSGSFLHFFLRGESVEEALQKASRVADFVVTQPGAIPQYDENLLKSIDECVC